MVQSRRRTRFASEAFQGLRVLRHVIGEELQSHEAAEFGVLGLVDHTHAAPAELLDDAVVRNGLADHAYLRTVQLLRCASDVIPFRFRLRIRRSNELGWMPSTFAASM